MKMQRILFLIINILLLNQLFAADLNNDWNRVVDLRGKWTFNIGDNPKWADPNYDDSNWTEIFVPAYWEDEGFPGYDGFAWYRTSFNVKSTANLFIHLGKIDDVDQVFINGKSIGLTGQFPPYYETAYHIDRIYEIPASYLHIDKENIVTVRVYDDIQAGGISDGKIGIYKKLNNPRFIESFKGLWRFTIHDNLGYAEYDYNDSEWNEIIVPMSWEAQGYENYNGFAWYRRQFNISSNFRDEDLILMLGKIDDIDEAYLNGNLIGRTGRMRDRISQIRTENNEWQKIRAYKIYKSDLYFDKPNVLAVKVADNLLTGGIYSGPVGILLVKEYAKWNRRNREKESFFFKFFR